MLLAAWALARWHANWQNWPAATAFLRDLPFALPGLPGYLGPLLLRIDILFHGSLPDLCRTAANVCLLFTEANPPPMAFGTALYSLLAQFQNHRGTTATPITL